MRISEPLLSLALVLAALSIGGCGSSPGSASAGSSTAPPTTGPSYDATIAIVDESGAPVPGATATIDGFRFTASASGSVGLAGLTRPVLAVIDAAGFLSEPVAIGRDEAAAGIRVKLLAATGAHGERRIVMHFAGDMMLGRRYLAPTRSDTAVVTSGDGGVSAREVVQEIEPLFGAAHIRALNLETVVGTLPQSGAYPKKRFLLQSPPEVLRALSALRANIVTLANNHTRDWLEDGIASTTSNLDGAGLPYAGAGLDSAQAADSATVTAASMHVGFLAYTTVNGDFVNDSLPFESDPVPSGLAASDSWQYDRRSFGFTGATVSTATASQRIGSVWRFIADSEARGIGDAERAALWNAASGVFPELQDWVARRGHGGANSFSAVRMTADIAALRAQGCDLIVVGLHAGLQFSEVKSIGTEIAAHAAVDAGADVVVAHHPHVLQGLEWYKGKLIAFSLGNFVFDQDFFTTFPTIVVRVVFEEKNLLEARVFPLVIAGYRPVAVVGATARSVLRGLEERTWTAAHGDRVPDGVGHVGQHALLAALDPSASMPGFQMEGASARLLPAPPSSTSVAITATAALATTLPGPALTRGGPSAPDLLFGRDLLRWGSFEAETCDAAAPVTPTMWTMNGISARAEARSDAPGGARVLHLSRASRDTRRVLARTVARIALPANRLFTLDGSGAAQPADGPATYSLRVFARLSGGGAPILRLDSYAFDDTNPTEDPTSLLLHTVETAIPVPADGAWHEVLLDIPSTVFAPVGPDRPNMILPYLALDPASAGPTDLLLDDAQVIEWREARALPDGFYFVDAVRAKPGSGTVAGTLERRGD